jgi:hypothetical protein
MQPTDLPPLSLTGDERRKAPNWLLQTFLLRCMSLHHRNLNGGRVAIRYRAARRHSPIPVRPRNAGCDSGPLIVGAREGDASGAGIRLATGACGVGGARRVVARA